jgi:hypothetical protein
MKLSQKKFDLIATIGLAIYIVSRGGFSTWGDINWNKISSYAVYIIIAFALRRYFYSKD